MSRDTDTFIGLINTVINDRFKYLVPREGQILKLQDDVQKGRVLVSIPSFGWTTQDNGVWCYGIDKNALTTLKVDDWVIVQFVDGDSNFPILLGRSNRIKNQLPKNYDGANTTHVIFESPNNKTHIKYDEQKNIMEIGNSNFKESARVDDETEINAITDAAFITWISQISGVVNGLVPGSVTPIPNKAVGKITTGSDQIKVGDA